MKLDNKQNDEMTRAGASVLLKDQKISQQKKNLLKKDGVKEQLNSFLFGDGANPFEEINKEHKVKDENK